MARSTSSPLAAPGTAVNAVPGRSIALHLLTSLRPGQWTKNLLVFAGLLFGLNATDPLTIVTAALSLILVAMFAAYLPARRASRVDPMAALRNE